MPAPTWSQWRILAASPAVGLPAHTVRERQLATLAAYASGNNPDGSNKSGAVTNLLTPEQSSFEAGTTGGWTASNSTIANSTAQAYDGTHSLAVTAIGGDGGTFLSIPSMAAAGLFPQYTYNVTAWVRPNTTTRPVFIFIRYYDASNAILTTTSSSTVTETASWFQYTVTAPAPATAVRMLCQVYISAMAAAEVHYIDFVSLGTV
jgi:hypothetical protein